MIQRGRRDALVPCVVQPRDVALVQGVRRYKFLTAPQLHELWWPDSSVQAADRRLLKLFRAGYLDRFRPISRCGSFPWTYKLGLEGHRLLQRAGLVEQRERFVQREVYDYGHVLHELQLNAWILAYRAAAWLPTRDIGSERRQTLAADEPRRSRRPISASATAPDAARRDGRS